MTKTEIIVGKTKMYATVVPVEVVFDELYDPPTFPADLIADRFQILEIDGYYLVIHELIANKPQAAKQEFKCFLDLDKAKDYLTMFGVEFEEEKEYGDE